MKILYCVTIYVLSMATALADEAAFTEAYPTVEQNLIAMDSDHNGVVTVYEVHEYLEKIHGKGYEKDLLDGLELTARGKSCTTPFAKALY